MVSEIKIEVIENRTILKLRNWQLTKFINEDGSERFSLSKRYYKGVYLTAGKIPCIRKELKVLRELLD